jgi:hypothetical protein
MLVGAGAIAVFIQLHLVSQYVDVATATPVPVKPGVKARMVPFIAIVAFRLVGCGCSGV